MQRLYYDPDVLEEIFQRRFGHEGDVSPSEEIPPLIRNRRAHRDDDDDDEGPRDVSLLPDYSSDEFSLYGDDDDEHARIADNKKAVVTKQPLVSAKVPASSDSVVVPPTSGENGKEKKKKKKKNGFIALSWMHANKAFKWKDGDASTVPVRRGPDYKKQGLKAPSKQSLYEFRGLDVLKSGEPGKKLVHLAKRLGEFPPLGSTSSSSLPHHLIVNLQLPSKAPSVFSSSSASDDGGFSIVFYFTLRPGLEESAKRDPDLRVALGLAGRFFSGALTGGRFKIAPFIDNLRELGIPSVASGVVEKFNGRPVIVYKTGTFTRSDPRAAADEEEETEEEPSYFEAAVDVHQFPYLARQSFYQLRQYSKNVRARVAFVIQGETDDELPERLLGLAEIHGGLSLENPLVVTTSTT